MVWAMDYQTLFNIAMGGIVAAMGWFARALWDAVASLRDDLHTLERDLPKTYLAKDEFKEGIREIKDILSEMFRKIDDLKDKKADK